MPLSREPGDMTLPELAQAMWGKEGNPDFQMAKAEMQRRQTQAQLAAQGLRGPGEECEVHAVVRYRLSGFSIRGRRGNGYRGLHFHQRIGSRIKHLIQLSASQRHHDIVDTGACNTRA